MDRGLRKLIKLMPPLDGQRHTKVNWRLLEQHVGLTYPASFKDFVHVYGASHWFDKLIPFYSCAQKVQHVQDYLKAIGKKLKWFVGNMYDAKFNLVQFPLYPEQGGLFPFMADIDSAEYCWLTESHDPDEWPVYCWMAGQLTVLENTSIADMFLGFLEREPPMVRLWGDVREFEPERIRIADVCADGPW